MIAILQNHLALPCQLQPGHPCSLEARLFISILTMTGHSQKPKHMSPININE